MTPSNPRWEIGAVAASTVVLGAAPVAVMLDAVPAGAATSGFAAAMVVNTLAFMALGARRQRADSEAPGIRPGRRTAAVLAALGVILGTGFALLLALPPADPEAPVLWLGLPPRAAVAVYGIGLLPVLLVPLGYAWAFPGTGADPATRRDGPS